MSILNAWLTRAPQAPVPQAPVVQDTRTPYERVRDNYHQLLDRFETRKQKLTNILEQTNTDLAECEAILVSLNAGLEALNMQIVEHNLLPDNFNNDN